MNSVNKEFRKMMFKKVLPLLGLFLIAPLAGRDVFLEFKGAYFHPTGSCFKELFSSGAALFGPELTVQLCENRDWYLFASFDYLKKNGHSIGLCSQTRVQLYPIAFGAKYFVSMCDCFDLYGGLGFQAVKVRTQDCAVGALPTISKWGYGGIAKFGGYYYLPHNFFLDVFVDYSFVKAGKNRVCNGLQLLKADVSGVIVGAAIGYRF